MSKQAALLILLSVLLPAAANAASLTEADVARIVAATPANDTEPTKAFVGQTIVAAGALTAVEQSPYDDATIYAQVTTPDGDILCPLAGPAVSATGPRRVTGQIADTFFRTVLLRPGCTLTEP